MVGVIDAFVYDLEKVRIGWDGETYRVDLVNDTTQPLQFVLCVDDDCQSLDKTEHVDPGESHGAIGDEDPPIGGW